MFKKTKMAKKKMEKSRKKYLEDNEISKLNFGGESCTVLRPRLMRKLAMCHMNFMSQIKKGNFWPCKDVLHTREKKKLSACAYRSINTIRSNLNKLFKTKTLENSWLYYVSSIRFPVSGVRF